MTWPIEEPSIYSRYAPDPRCAHCNEPTGDTEAMFCCRQACPGAYAKEAAEESRRRAKTTAMLESLPARQSVRCSLCHYPVGADALTDPLDERVYCDYRCRDRYRQVLRDEDAQDLADQHAIDDMRDKVLE